MKTERRKFKGKARNAKKSIKPCPVCGYDEDRVIVYDMLAHMRLEDEFEFIRCPICDFKWHETMEYSDHYQLDESRY
jgi:DNA-directed RNA polymerase subunit M/transcription elongation factor TFIIS